MSIVSDKYYRDDVVGDVVIFNIEEGDYWLLAYDELTSSDVVISYRFNTEIDVYFANGIQEIINNCDLFDFTVINGEIYKIED